LPAIDGHRDSLARVPRAPEAEMARSNHRRADRKSGLHLRTRRKSLWPDASYIVSAEESIYDVSGKRPLLLRVCWERNLAVLADVTPYIPRPRSNNIPVATDPGRIKRISIQHTLIDLQNIIYEGECFAVVEGELPASMDWEQALTFRSGCGRRIRERFERRSWPVPTYAAVITARYAMPHGLRLFCPGDFGEQMEVFVEAANCLNPTVRLIDYDDIREEVFDLNNHVALVPKLKKRFLVSRGSRPEIEEFDVGSVEEGRAVLHERLGDEFEIAVVHAQAFGNRQRAEYRIKKKG
jgi:hypothetical protein